MKKRMGFLFKNFNSLLEILENGLDSIYVEYEVHGRPDVIWLGLTLNSVLKINSVVKSVDSWDEIGSLVFELMDKDKIDFKMSSIDKKWKAISSIEKLVFEDDTVVAESGLSIKSENSEIIIIASSFPYSIEILADFLNQDFDPECEIEQYKYLPIEI